MIGTARVIENDLFGIAERLKSIDPTYFVAYSYKKCRYEVHSRSQRGGTLCVVVPYGELDERTVRLVLKTRSERKEKLLAETEAHNARLEKSEREKLRKNIEKEVEKAYGKL